MKKVSTLFLNALSTILFSTAFSTVLLSAMFSIALLSCNSNDDTTEGTGLEGSGITITDDVDCCSAEEALQVYKFLQTVKIIPEMSTVVDGKYNVFAYSKTGKFNVGYNDVYFVATKRISGNYIKNFNVSNLSPLMNMAAMGKQHSTPVGAGVESFDNRFLAVKRGWVSFLMPASDSNTWSVSYDVQVLGSSAKVEEAGIEVNALSDGQDWVKSFKVGDDTYFVSLVNPADWKIGTNNITAYVSKKSADIKKAYAPAEENFTIDFTPTMPDMGDHTSPDNVALTKQSDGSYQGIINLTMTGWWRLHLTVKDKDGNVVADDISLSVTI